MFRKSWKPTPSWIAVTTLLMVSIPLWASDTRLSADAWVNAGSINQNNGEQPTCS